NLEKLANHKGSFLGENPGGQPSQKNFESYLVKSLIKCKNKKCIIMEGESRKIGKIHLNSNFYNLMKKGRKIWIELPIEVRAERLALEYNRPIEYLISRINLLNRYISKDLLNEIIESLNSGDKLKASFLLLQNHYDPIYRNYSPGVSKERKYCLVLNTEIDINHVFQKLKDFIEKELNCAETF
ncbi:MAG: hypothetical protein KDK36_21410, partial [Leptospiraceae bacterium]|nr:hypothetical protein [Leptospiraceae bacterium]